MKKSSISVFALVAALAMAVPAISHAQTAAGSVAGEAAGTASGAASGTTDAVDATAGGNASAGANASGNASTDGSTTTATTNAGLTLDVNADGTISAEEAGAFETALGGGIKVDADGDGTISEEEANAATTALASLNTDDVSCDDSGLDATIAAMGMPDMAALGAATNVSVVVVADCDASEVSSALAGEGATNIRAALEANASAVAAIQARGATLADVLGATSSGDTVTVYVALETAS
jgi:hypothetical protein